MHPGNDKFTDGPLCHEGVDIHRSGLTDAAIFLTLRVRRCIGGAFQHRWSGSCVFDFSLFFSF
jgi:hypothetical protein